MIEDVIKLVYQAGDIAMKYYKKEYSIATKTHNRDYVTTADLEIDKFINEELKKLTPDYDILTEENVHRPKTFDGNVRIIDPIDGTIGFVEETDGFSVMIGLASNGIPTLGVIYYPALDILLFAEKGKGAFWKQGMEVNKCEMSLQGDINKSTMYYYGITNERESKDALQLSEILNMQTFNGSNHIHDLVLGRCEVVGGGRDSAPGGHRDICAPAIIVTEAGGIYTDHYGNMIDFKKLEQKNGRFAANNEHIFNEISKVIFSKSC